MGRRLFNILSALSLVLCIATGGLWVRSYWCADYFSYDTGDERGGQVSTSLSSMGHIWLATGECWADNRSKGWDFHVEPAHPVYIGNRDSDSWYRFGFTAGKVDSAVFDSYEVAVPHWFLFLLTAIAPTAQAIHKWRMRRRPHLALCPTCSYDLRATPDRCPECGTAIVASSQPRSGGSV